MRMQKMMIKTGTLLLRGTIVSAGILSLLLFRTPSSRAAVADGGMSQGMTTSAPSGPSSSGPVPPTGFAVEGFAGGDTSLSGSYQTTQGQTVPYDFGSAPVWGVRIGKMVFSPLFVYLTFQQTYFSQNTHSIVGFGGNYYLPAVGKIRLVPYMNATFGASYNTYTGTDAQAGYAWMLGAGALYPLSPVWQIFLEADASFETAPTGINTAIGNPPGNISRVSDTWSVPVMIGVRYCF